MGIVVGDRCDFVTIVTDSGSGYRAGTVAVVKLDEGGRIGSVAIGTDPGTPVKPVAPQPGSWRDRRPLL